MTQEYQQDEGLVRELRDLREEVRRETGTARTDKGGPAEQRYLYGDRDLELFPQLQQGLSELASLYAVQERPFSSNLPVIGPLIARFRDLFNRISTRWYVQPLVEQQVRFNAAVLPVLQDLRAFHQRSSLDLVRRMDALFDSLDQAQAAANARLRDLGDGQVFLGGQVNDLTSENRNRALEIQDLAERIRDLQQRTGDMGWQVLAVQEKQKQMGHQQALDRRAAVHVRTELERVLALVGSGRELTPVERERLQQLREGLSDVDYFRFEDRYRPESAVREDQKIYVPYFQGRGNVLDLGCGKGEFLEILREAGVEAYGVDLNRQMVQASEEKGLVVYQGDALAHLAGLPDGSLGGIFAAHLVEHLPVPALGELAQLALAKLQPDAYIILETPNPLCLWALANYFYMDMSHVKPVHPQALSFVLEMQGLRDVEVRYLHPVPEHVRMVLLPDAAGTPLEETVAQLNQNLTRLNEALFGYADYAVVARK